MMEMQKAKFDLLIITAPLDFLNETEFLNFFLDNGTNSVYLRKESYSPQNIERFFQEIKPEHHQKILLPASIVDELTYKKYRPSMKIKERERDSVNLHNLPGEAILSTSIHDISELNLISDKYEYVFYSPVFESISKSGYKPKLSLEEMKMELGNRVKGKGRLIALGGVNDKNILHVKEAGFDGAALLGSIWESDHPEDEFLKILSKVH